VLQYREFVIVICYSTMNSVAAMMYILTHLNCKIKNERLESIDHLHLLHKYKGPDSCTCHKKERHTFSITRHDIFSLPKNLYYIIFCPSLIFSRLEESPYPPSRRSPASLAPASAPTLFVVCLLSVIEAPFPPPLHHSRPPM
jgi:hypothetical protein